MRKTRRKRLTKTKPIERTLKQERQELYGLHKSLIAEDVLRTILRAFATTEAIIAVNEKLEDEFNLDEDTISLKEIQQLVKTVISVEVAKAVVSKSTLSRRHQNLFVERFIARLLPSRDGDVKALPNQPGQKLSRRELEQSVSDEAHRIRQSANAKASAFTPKEKKS